MYPHYSQDGKRLAFTSTRTGYQEIWVTNADGSQPVQLTDLRHQLTEAGDWSPENDVIGFVSQDRGQRQIYLVEANGGPARPITAEAGVKSGTGWSRDGLWYYYNSLSSGREEVRRAPRTGGPSESVTPDGGKCGFEAGTGAFYYCQTSGEGTLMRRTAVGDREVRLFPKSCSYAFLTAPRGFYYKADGANDIYRYDETAGRSVRVVRGLPGPVLQFTVSPDGHWLAYSPSQVKSVDLMIIEKFNY
jgi:Tol biopolymer transport system component